MANYVHGKPNALIDLMAPKTTRQKYDMWFRNMHRHGEDPNYYNRIFEEIENELPFKDDVEHDKWSQMWEGYMGEPETEDFTNAILSRLDEDYSGTDNADAIADDYFSTRIGGYKPNPNIVKTVGEDMDNYYNREFFKQANGNRDEFIRHNLARFGIPKGSTRAKETEHYGSVFDKLSKGNPYDPEKLPDEGLSSEELIKKGIK